ncbi:MAG: hypothetical protein JWR74_3030 [Polaromonas sp.]|jgi:hypothetical protein|nr:hypothetical protein [Polaromonas sp.]
MVIQLKIEHADLDALVDKAAQAPPVDELMFKRLKKRRLLLRDRIARLESLLTPPELA